MKIITVASIQSTKTLDSAPGHLNDPRSVEGSLHIIRKADPKVSLTRVKDTELRYQAFYDQVLSRMLME